MSVVILNSLTGNFETLKYVNYGWCYHSKCCSYWPAVSQQNTLLRTAFHHIKWMWTKMYPRTLSCYVSNILVANALTGLNYCMTTVQRGHELATLKTVISYTMTDTSCISGNLWGGSTSHLLDLTLTKGKISRVSMFSLLLAWKILNTLWVI